MIIDSLKALEILDSRGFPTLHVQAVLQDGSVGGACVPSGASTGSLEAYELRDKDSKRYCGKGVLQAVSNVNTTLAQELCGIDIENQTHLDNMLCKIDGSEQKSSLGANAILGVSLAAAHARSKQLNLPLYAYIQDISSTATLTMPLPMMNIVNGGSHADNNIDFQEFMIQPLSAPSFSEALRMGAEVFHSLKSILSDKGYITAVGDEGGFAPNFHSNTEVMDTLMFAIEKAGYIAGEDISFALDCASTEFLHEELYHVNGEKFSSERMVQELVDLVKQYPILSIEDGLGEDDWQGWKILTHELGDKIQLVGDDIFVTNTSILERGIKEGVANSILIKPNQIGTLTQTINAIKLAKDFNYNAVISHRSGETEDTTIADIAVGTAAGQIKTGSLCRSDRIAKYNRLLFIEQDEISAHKPYLGRQELKR